MAAQGDAKNGAVDTEPPEKRAKVEVGNINEAIFSGFVMTRILNESSRSKMICVEGKLANNEDTAIVIMEKTPFSESTAQSVLSGTTQTDQDLKNDIYHQLQLMPQPKFNGIKATLIHPASEKHIEKYSRQEMLLVNETYEDYKNITLPVIESQQFSIQWVYNILEKKCESERIVFEDSDPETGFILLPDLKWDAKQVEDLYLVAIVQKHNLKSLRDLNSSHLPLLSNIYEKGCAAILEKYEVPKNKLRIYFHYQPSYYHLHVHFTHLHYDAPGSDVFRGHLLTDVIENITIDSSFYQKKMLTYTTKTNGELGKKFQEAGKI